MRTRRLLLGAIILLTAATGAAWVFVKLLRVLAPELLGLHCSPAGVCVDDLSRLQEAIALRNDAIQFVNSNIGQIASPSRAVFCSTRKCALEFGFINRFAYNVGTFGMGFSPLGWKPFLVRHELIHHLQDERLGILNT